MHVVMTLMDYWKVLALLIRKFISSMVFQHLNAFQMVNDMLCQRFSTFLHMNSRIFIFLYVHVHYK